jgi:hypothetical protein
MIAVSSLDLKIILWDVIKRLVKQVVKIETLSIEKLVFSADYRVLFAS